MGVSTVTQKPTLDAQKRQLSRSVKIGLIRELFRQGRITQAQLERLMQLQRGRRSQSP